MKEMFMNKCIWWLWITQGVFAPKVAKVFGVVDMEFVGFFVRVWFAYK